MRCRQASALPYLLLAFLVAAVIPSVHAQESAPWQGKKCAVALTYDDALHVHLDKVVPLLDSLGFRGTFYLSGFFPVSRARVKDWQSVARRGHELGNHTLFHPCEGNRPGREWVPPDYDLNGYTVRRMVDEITMASLLLESMDGGHSRTFAYPCGDTKAGDSSYVEKIKDLFPGARGVHAKMQQLHQIDPYDIGSYMINGESGDELTGLVQEAMRKQALLVFLFHGVGGEHPLNVSLDAHRTLLEFLKQHESEVWVAPMREICDHMHISMNGGR